MVWCSYYMILDHKMTWEPLNSSLFLDKVYLRPHENGHEISQKKFGWLVVLRIYVALAVYQPYRDLGAGDNQSMKFKWRG